MLGATHDNGKLILSLQLPYKTVTYHFQVYPMSVVVLVALMVLHCAKCEEFLVASSCSSPSSQQCHTLSHYTANPHLFSNGAIFKFLSGVHTLDKILEISGVSNVTLQGEGETVNETTRETSVKITCNGRDASLFISNSSNINITGLTLTDCGSQYHTSKVDGNNLGPGAVVMLDVYNIEISHSSFQSNTGVGLMLVNAFNTTIKGTSVLNNKVYGNAFILYTNLNTCLNTSEPQVYHLDITDSEFSYGFGASIASGLTLLIQHDCNFRIDVELNRVKSYGNNGQIGGNIVMHVANIEYYSILIDSLESQGGMGGGTAISVTYNSESINTCPCSYSPPPQVTRPLEVRNSLFFQNVAIFGAGLIVQTEPSDIATTAQEIVIDSCQFFDNIGYAGSGLYITQVELSSSDNPLSFSLINLTINNNLLVNPGPSCAMFLYGIRVAKIQDLLIFDNNDTGLLLYNSLVMFSGIVRVSNNTANEGAGMALYGNSIMVINNGTDMLFYNNRAVQIGGGIYIKSRSPFLEVCRMQIAHLTNTMTPNSRLQFVDNTAGIAGSAIYGGMISTCQNLLPSSTPDISVSRLYQVIDVSQQEGLSVVSSDAVSICFCNDNNFPDCTSSVSYKSFVAYPGDVINVGLVAIGQIRGLTQGFVAITSSVDTQQYVVRTPSVCSNINHTVVLFNDTREATNVTVSVGIIDPEQPLTPPIPVLAVIITVLPCPPGFSLSLDTGVCVCSSPLDPIGVTCNISTDTLTREGNRWIGYKESEQCIIIYEDCPFDYCNSSSVTFDITSPNPQCLNNRAGLLCGGCNDGLSLMLGYSQCGKCTNDYIALIVPFAAAGIVLVILLIALNLTVSIGTVNGLIFYANIIKINEAYLFPNGSIPFLSQFISWLNLDLGIPTCFFDGMDTYSNMWLQFAFPFYIWTIIGAIVCACKFSNRLSKLIGSNVVPVLATLLLLSYTKLFSTILLILDLVVVDCGSVKFYRWGLDPNLAYLSGSHAALFIFALIVLVCLVLPYVLLLLLNPIIGGKLSQFTCCRFCSQLKPFFDAYFGPLKDSYRWWVGVFLLARLVLLGISFSNKSNTFALTISLSAILIAVEAGVGGVYQQTHLNTLEIWFLLLIVLHSTVANNGYGYIGGIVITSLAFITFVGIIAYHVYQKNRKFFLRLKNKLKEQKLIRRSTLREQLISSDEYDIVNNETVTRSVVDTNRRESLLFDVASDSYNTYAVN